jgi:phosphate transport system ATP-binding protein
MDKTADLNPACPTGATTPPAAVLETRGLNVSAGGRPILRHVNLRVLRGQAFGIIGPSGAGKSTLLKCFNRMIDLTPNLRVDGTVLYQGKSVRADEVNADQLRERVGMIFQQPVVFPRSIFQNVIFGAQRLKRLDRHQKSEVVERALREASLWDEVKDRLAEPALRLSVGQQQRLCLARALAVGPEVILMDEPTSALDPKSTEAIETLIHQLKAQHTIVLVTHNLAQARRVADWVACVCVRDGAGEVVESARCDAVFTNPTCRDVSVYLQGTGE